MKPAQGANWAAKPVQFGALPVPAGGHDGGMCEHRPGRPRRAIKNRPSTRPAAPDQPAARRPAPAGPALP